MQAKRAEIMDKMEALFETETVDGKEVRSLPEAKQDEFDTYEEEVRKLDEQIARQERIERFEKLNEQRKLASGPQAPAVHTREHKFDWGKAFREGNRLTGLEKETSEENARKAGISSDGLVLSYRQVNELFGKVEQRVATSVGMTDYANITPTILDDQLSIIDYQTLLDRLGVSYRRGLSGKFQLNTSAAQTAAFYAEGAAVANAGQAPGKVELSPRRVGWGDTFTKESLAAASPALHRQIIMDGVRAIERAIEKDLLAKMASSITAHTGYVGGTDPDAALTRSDLVTLEGALKDVDNIKYLTNRLIYNKMRDVKVDAGSGRFLVEGTPAEGFTHTGVPIYASGFMTNTKDVFVGDFSECFIGDWGVIEILQNPYIKQKEGEVEVTVNQLVDTAVRNTAAFAYASNVVM